MHNPLKEPTTSLSRRGPAPGTTGTSTDLFDVMNRIVEKGIPRREAADGWPLRGEAPLDESLNMRRAITLANSARHAARRDGRRENITAKDDAANARQAAAHARTRRKKLRRERNRATKTLRALAGFTYRADHAWRYVITSLVLVVVDIASVVGASETALGDIGYLPWLLGGGIGVSIVAIGSVSGAVKREGHERTRRPPAAPKKLRSYPNMFGESDGPERWAANLFAGGLVMVTASIFVLRAVTAGSEIGVGFATMSTLTLLGSYANGYHYGPLDKATKATRKLTAQLAVLNALIDDAEQVRQKAAGVQTRPKSITKAYRSEGNAAAALIIAEAGYTPAVDNPAVCGFYEPAPTPPEQDGDPGAPSTADRVPLLQVHPAGAEEPVRQWLGVVAQRGRDRVSGPGYTVGPLTVAGPRCGPLGIASGVSPPAAAGSKVERAAMVGAEFGPAGCCPQWPVLDVIITDLSPSLGYGGSPGNDPAGLRHPAVLRAAQQIAAHCRCDHEHLQVFSFDLAGDFDTGRLGFDRAGMKALSHAMSSPNYGSGISTLGPSLAAARQIIDEHHGAATLTVLSDFQLNDMASIPALGDTAAAVHAVVFTAAVPDELHALEHHGRATVTRVTPGDRPADVALAVYAQLTRFRAEPRPRRHAQPKAR